MIARMDIRPAWMRRVFLLIIVIVIMAVAAYSVAAQEELTFVYGTNHFNGAVFSSAFVPDSVDTFYLISDHISIVAGRLTRVYYWPLTNELKPDWDEANIVVEGELEILENDRIIQTIALTDYVIQYDARDRFGTTELFLGDAAVVARQNFEDLQKQYREDLAAYFQELNNYRQAFQAALAELQAGNITEDELPEPPEAQEDLSLFSTDLLMGFPVNLPDGNYTVQLRLPDGSIQPNSRKRLVVFSPIQEGIGYNVITEERWTVPEESKEANQIIYSLSGKKMYLEPFYQIQFNELFYTRLNNPQDTQARRDRNVWIPFEYVKDVMLEVNSAGSSKQIAMENYFVRQLTGSALGYEIMIHNPGSDRDVTFSGFAIDVDSPEMHIEVVDSGGNLLQYSQREIRVLNTSRSIWVYVLSGLPLLGGVAAVLMRRRSVDSGNLNGQKG
ncbi:MAG: hypothetical protein JW757_04950 [Anaerolineales bacterium]|nr:hypothetical protein [Anaerolineales bacterium]